MTSQPSSSASSIRTVSRVLLVTGIVFVVFGLLAAVAGAPLIGLLLIVLGAADVVFARVYQRRAQQARPGDTDLPTGP